MSKEGIVLPKDFGIDEDYFSCPKCSSSVIVLDEEMVQQNTITTLKENEDKNLVLKCKNCGFKDLLGKFIEARLSISRRDVRLERLQRYFEELNRMKS